MASKDKTERLVEKAAVEASEEIADRVPGLDANDASEMTRSGLDQLKHAARGQPLVAVLAAISVGYLVGMLTR